MGGPLLKFKPLPLDYETYPSHGQGRAVRDKCSERKRRRQSDTDAEWLQVKEDKAEGKRRSQGCWVFGLLDRQNFSAIGGLFTLSAGTEDGGADVGNVCAGFPAVSGKKETVNTVNWFSWFGLTFDSPEDVGLSEADTNLPTFRLLWVVSNKFFVGGLDSL